MTRRPLLLISLLLLAFGAASCGGDDVDVNKTLRETFGEEKNIKSGRLDLNLRLELKGLPTLEQPISARLSGPFASTKSEELPRFDFEAGLTAAGQSLRGGAVSTGDKGFVRWQDQAYALSEQLYQQFKTGYAEQAKQSEGEGEGVSFQSLGVDPQRWLRDPKYVGKQDVGGAETLHIRASLDVAKWLEDVNRILGRAEQIEGQQGERARQLTEAERRQIADAIQDARLEIWTGEEDKIMRRMNLRVRFAVDEANRQAAQGLESGTIRFDLTLGAVNDEQEIVAPKDARPLEELTSAAGGGQPGQGSETPQPAGTPYEECVAEAAGDISKLQECAGLAGG